MGANEDSGKRNLKSGTPKKPFIYYYFLVILAVMVLNALVFPMMEHSVEVPYSEFLKELDAGNVKDVYVSNGESQIQFTKKDQKQWNVSYKTGPIPGDDLVKRLQNADVENFTGEIQTKASPLLSFLMSWVAPILMFVVIGNIMGRMLSKRMGGSNAMTFGKSNAKIYARAVAGEAHVPFFSISGSEFVEMFVGMGAAKVRDLFKQANDKAPCIVFIDEIDTIGKKRDGGGMSGNDEREQTLNQLLTEMDGFDGKKGVVILAATNRPESLDKALLRPGRFDRRVPVELPDLKGREAILKVHGQNVKMSDDVDYNAIARATAGASGAELANIINEAALRAVRMGRSAVVQADLEESVETVIAGYQKKNAVISQKERRIVAYHEVGHALVAACQSHSAPVQKITIIPRTSGALGYTMQVEQGERYLMSREEALDKIATFTGGRAAEELIFHSITTGASNDIEQATKIARSLVTRFGMTDEFDMVAMETVTNQYLGGDTSLICAPDTAKRIDEQVVSIVKEQHRKALSILRENEGRLHEIAAYLLEKETITGDEFMEIFNRGEEEQVRGE